MLATKTLENEFFFFAGYAILQATIMAVAWNILGGFTGYVNFGSAGFFAIGAYTSVALVKALDPPIVVPLVVAALLGGLVGLGTGYLTLRLRGVYFAIATLAMAIVFETFVNNWDYVGGATGAYILTPDAPWFFDSYIEFLFALILLLALMAVAIARHLKLSRIGRGLAAIRDDEIAAECAGVPTLRLKLVSTGAMGALMGVAGAPFPFFMTYVDPLSAFNLTDRGQRHRHADDRRHRHLVRPGGRRSPARLDPGDRHGHDLVRDQRPDRRGAAGGLHHGGAAGHRRADPGFLAKVAPPMAEPLLEVEGLSKRFGGFIALDAVSLQVGAGERVGLIGPNGSGKTTMINCISGALHGRRRAGRSSRARTSPGCRPTGARVSASRAASRSRARSAA